MSWLSQAKNAFLNLLEGKTASTTIVENPTTPVETAINAAATIVLPAAAAVAESTGAAAPAAATIEIASNLINDASHPASVATGDFLTTLGTEAAAAATGFLTTKVGALGTEMTDAGAQALATAAVAQMSGSSNKTEEEIAAGLHEFLTGFFGTPAAAPAGQTS